VTATDTDVRLHVMRSLLDAGRAPSAEETAAALRMESAEARAAYRRLADGRVLVLQPGTLDVWMANPLSAVPTPFHVRTVDRDLFGNCIWDALGVLAMLGEDGSVETRCPDCEAVLGLEVQQAALRPGEGVIHFAVPAAQWWEDIGYT